MRRDEDPGKADADLDSPEQRPEGRLQVPAQVGAHGVRTTCLAQVSKQAPHLLPRSMINRAVNLFRDKLWTENSKHALRTGTFLFSTLTSVCRRNSCFWTSSCWSGGPEWRSPGCSRCRRRPWRDRRGFLGQRNREEGVKQVYDTHSSQLETLMKKERLGLSGVAGSHDQDAEAAKSHEKSKKGR